MLRKDVFGLIYSAEENINLRELVTSRSVGALPLGGRYRTIDFILSNMVNSGIRNIAVLPRKNYQSMMDHLGSGKEWSLNRKKDGLFFLPPYDNSEDNGNYKGTLDMIRGASSYWRHVTQEYCLLSGASTVFRFDFSKMFEFHLQSGADITLLYSAAPQAGERKKMFQDLRLDVDENGLIRDMAYQQEGSNLPNLSMDVYLIRKDLLRYLVDSAISRERHSFIQDILLNNDYNLKIYGYQHDGYVGRLDTVASYLQLNMDFLDDEIQQELFYNGNPIYTKIKDEAPAKYGAHAKVNNSLIASGCIIDGTVENSILFRGVRVGKDVHIKNSVVMQDTIIHDGVDLEWVILDKLVSVETGNQLKGSRQYPLVIPKDEKI